MSDRELDIAERVRKACLQAAIAGYDDARMSGLCQQGAWDVALDRIRSLDVDALLGEDTQLDDDQNSNRRPSGS